MDLGNAIRICRAHRGLSQAVLAEKAGISLSYLSLIENNKRDPTLSSLRRIADAINIPLNLLVFLAADRSDVRGLPGEVQDKLSALILKLLNEDEELQASLPI